MTHAHLARSHKRIWLWLVPLLLLAAFLAFRLLDVDLLWGDEARTYWEANLPPYSALPPGEHLARLIDREPIHVPGYFLLMRVWGGFVGNSSFAVRSLSLFLGLLGIASTYRLSATLYSKRTGLYAATILTGSSLVIYYMHEARPYALLLAIAPTVTWAYWRLQHKNGRIGSWLIFVLSSAALVYTHWLGLVIPLGIGLYHLMQAKTRRWWLILLTMIAANLSILPWALNALPRIMDELGDGRDVIAFSATDIVSTLLYSFSNGGVVLLLALFVFALFQRRRLRQPVRLLFITLIAGLLAVIVINTMMPAFIHVRYVFALWATLALIAAFGLDYLYQKHVPVSIVLVCWLIVGSINSLTLDFAAALPNAEPTIIAGELPEVIRVLKAEGGHDDLMVFHIAPTGQEQAQQVPLDLYFQWQEVRLLQPGLMGSVFEDDYRAEVDSLVNDAPLVWMVRRTDITQPTLLPVFEDQLLQNYLACDQWQPEERLDVQVYADQSAPISAEYELSDEQGVDLRVHRASRYNPGIASIIMDWTLPDTESSLFAALHIYDAQDALIRQRDFPIGQQMSRSCGRYQINLQDLSPGDYRLDLVLYDSETSERYTPETTTFETQSNSRLSLMPIRVID